MGVNRSKVVGEGTEGPASAPPLRHIPELDGIRGLAALSVFFHHILFSTLNMKGWSLPAQIFAWLAHPGSYGVNLFFILSGFLITSILLADRSKPHYYNNFYWKRALRILPLYILCLLAILAFYPNSKSFVLLCVFFISNFAIVFHVTGLGPFWTLAVEEQFYLIWPTVVHRRSLEQVKRWSAILVVLTILARFAAAVIGHHDYHLTFFCCDGLAAGAWMACWMKQRTQGIGDGTNIQSYAIMAMFAGSASVALSLLPRLSLAFSNAFEYTGACILLAGAFLLVLIHRGAPALAIFRSAVLTFFGLISYAFYMFHLFVLELYDAKIGIPLPNHYAAYFIRFTAVFAGTLVLCLLSRYLFEIPIMSLRKYVLKPSRLQAGVVHPQPHTASPVSERARTESN
jgi:peptidoglycan/LPS O-acetylase OafA/YrhL